MSLDTNQIAQAGQALQAVHEQVQLNWPFVCAVAVIIARELKRVDEWLAAKAEWVIEHGGAARLLKKLIWNPPVPPARVTGETGKPN